jgi:hypothetical protein
MDKVVSKISLSAVVWDMASEIAHHRSWGLSSEFRQIGQRDIASTRDLTYPIFASGNTVVDATLLI